MTSPFPHSLCKRHLADSRKATKGNVLSIGVKGLEGVMMSFDGNYRCFTDAHLEMGIRESSACYSVFK